MLSPITILIWFTSLLPAHIPANLIYMGPHVEPIHSIKVKRGHVVETTSMLLTPSNFIRLKSTVQNSPDLCTLAVDESVKKCMAGLEREQQIMLDREHDDKALLKAYETRLLTAERELDASLQKQRVLLYTAVSMALISTASLTLALR